MIFWKSVIWEGGFGSERPTKQNQYFVESEHRHAAAPARAGASGERSGSLGSHPSDFNASRLTQQNNRFVALPEQ